MGEAYPLPGDTERDPHATDGTDPASSAMRSLRAEVAALRDAVTRQNTRLERFDAFTESMFSRVERAVRAGVGDTAPAATPASTGLAEDDRATLSAIPARIDRLGAHLDQLGEYLTHLDARLTEVQAEVTTEIRTEVRDVAPRDALPLTDVDRAVLTTITARLDDLADAGRQRDERVATIAEAVAEVQGRVDAPSDLSDADRDTLAGIAARLHRLEQRTTESTSTDLSDTDRDLLATLAARLDQLDRRLVTLGDDERQRVGDLVARLDRIETQLATPVEGRGSLATPETAAVPGPVTDERARAQAIADIADAIDRAVGGMSKAKLKKLQRSLDQAAATAPAARPVRAPKPAPASPQRQVVHLEREDPSDD